MLLADVAVAAPPTASTQPRVLIVDDDQYVLAAVARVLRSTCDVVTAPNASAAMDLVQQGPSFAVVLSDFQMPGMDGAEFLKRIRETSPDTTRVLLTGRRDLAATVAAVNQGEIFRFLGKPITPEKLRAVVNAACEHHRLVSAERVLLEQTLHGSIKALMSLLALAQPGAVGRTSRIKRLVTLVVDELRVDDRWSIDIATLLSQVGCVSLPADTMQRIEQGERLTEEEQALANRLPVVAEDLLAGIPRLESVRAILRYQGTHFDGTHSPDANVHGAQLPLGSRILKAAMDFDALETRGMNADEALAVMLARSGWYDVEILATARERWTDDAARQCVRHFLLSQVAVGMTFAADLIAPDGMLLVARGQEVTQPIVERTRGDWSEWASTRQVAVLMRA